VTIRDANLLLYANKFSKEFARYKVIYKLLQCVECINDLIVNVALEALYIYTKKVEMMG
jgi:hypothetical protein